MRNPLGKGLIAALLLNLMLWGVLAWGYYEWVGGLGGFMSILLWIWGISILSLGVLFFVDWRNNG